ncbi:hypothetical protein D3C71_346890 [compost metagenome]|jgi:hypothetical protein
MRAIAILASAAFLTGCASTPQADEQAVVECEAFVTTGEVRNCVLISQTLEGSEFGAFAVGQVSKSRLVGRPGEEAWSKFRTTVRGRPTS